MTDRGKEFLIRNTSIIDLQRNRVNKFRAIPARKRSARPQGIYELHAGGGDGGEDAASYPITFLSGKSAWGQEGIRGKSPWNELTGQIFLGDKAFIENLRGTDSDDLTEIPRCQRHATRPAIDEILSRESIVDREARKKAIYLAYVEYGYTLKQIAQHLKIHYATVSRTVKELESNNV